MSANRETFDALWRGPVIKTGVTTLGIAITMCFLPNVYLYVKHGAIPPLNAALEAWGMIAMMFGAFYVVEPVSYYPILGMSGTYMSFLSGNISNVRVPCSAVAQDTVGVETGSPEAEIISTLGIAGSIITNLIFVSLAALLGAGFLEMLPDSIVLAFKTYTVPAVFGATLGQFFVKFPLIGVIALVISAFFFFVVPYMISFITNPELIEFFKFFTQAWVVLIFAIFGTMAITRKLYKAKIL